MTFWIGVIGAGAHGERYVRHGSRDVPGLGVSALCRRTASPGQELALKYGARYHAEATDLITDPSVDGVVVCTPPASHFELAAAVLAAGKPLLLEKPMTGSLTQAERLARLAATTRVPVLVGHSLRWNAVLLKVRELWPQLGRVKLIRLAQRLAPTTLSWQRDVNQTVGGSVLLTGVHLFDLARWLTGAEFERVDSRQEHVANPRVEDLFLARATLSDGCWASLEVSKYTQSRACWLEAVGEHGQLQADYLHGGVVLRCGSDEQRFAVSAQTPTLPLVLRDWLAMIKEGAPSPVSVQDGLATLRMVDACYRSAAAGREVEVDRA
jgi:predicted dehydrogenase